MREESSENLDKTTESTNLNSYLATGKNEYKLRLSIQAHQSRGKGSLLNDGNRIKTWQQLRDRLSEVGDL